MRGAAAAVAVSDDAPLHTPWSFAKKVLEDEGILYYSLFVSRREQCIYSTDPKVGGNLITGFSSIELFRCRRRQRRQERRPRGG